MSAISDPICLEYKTGSVLLEIYIIYIDIHIVISIHKTKLIINI